MQNGDLRYWPSRSFRLATKLPNFDVFHNATFSLAAIDANARRHKSMCRANETRRWALSAGIVRP